MESLYWFFARKWTNKAVDQKWVRKLSHLAGVFFLNGEQARGERLVPLDGKRGDVAYDAGKFFDSYVPGKRNSVEAGGADGGVAEKLVERDSALIPALGEQGIFKDGKHHAGIAGAARADFFQRGGDDADGGHGAAGAERLLGNGFDGCADGSAWRGCGRKIDAHVDPALLAVDAQCSVFDVKGGVVEGVHNLALGCGKIRSILRSGGEQAGGGEADGELVAGTGVIRAGEKWRVRGNAGVGGKVEIAFAVIGGFGEFLDQAGGGVDGGPVDPGVVGDGQ